MFFLYAICKTRYSKTVKNKEMQIFMANLKMKRKSKKKKIDLPERAFKPQIFSNFPAHDLKVRVARSNQNKLLKK